MSELLRAAENYFSALNWGTPTWDLMLIIFFIAASLFYGLSIGRDRVLVILLSIYIALAMVSFAPYIGVMAARIPAGDLFAFRVTTFVALLAVLFLLLSRSALARGLSKVGAGNILQVIMLSFLHVGLLISVVLSFLPVQAMEVFSPFLRGMFLHDWARLLWIASPIAVLVLFKEAEE